MTEAQNSPLIVTDSTDKHIARLEALHAEINELGQRAPVPIIKKRAARYRMPRRLKQQLMDRFVHATPMDENRPKVMIVAAHQDDETVGAGARLCMLSDAWIVHVTDGAPADERVAQRFGFASRDEYAQARRQELHAALDVAGVLPEHRLCLNYVDGEASLRMVDLVLRITDLLDNISPDVVITHPYEGGQTDHDATAFAVHLACGLLRREGVKPPALLEMTSYFRREGRRIVHEFIPHKRADIDRRVVELPPELQRKKQEMYTAFQTQQHVIQTFSTTIEKFRPAPRYVFTLPPHEGELNYERFGDPYRGERWRRDAEVALAELKLRRSA
jgi:LmbE family N-acetylglucosaminyl deacetylase